MFTLGNRIKDVFLSQVMGFASMPDTIAFIEVNYECVLRCKMCRLWTSEFKKKRMGDKEILSQSEIEAVIDQFASAGIQEICFLGGEPFLRKDLLELIAYCKFKGLRCITVSNGFLIEDQLAEKIVRSGLDVLGISIDGANSELHDRMRGVDGAFKNTINAIKLIKRRQRELESEFPEIAIACTISSNNFVSLPEMVDLAKDLGVAKIRFQCISVVDKSVVEQTNQMMREKVVGEHNFVGIPRDFMIRKEQIEKKEEVIKEIKKRAGSEIECHLDPVLLYEDKSYLENGIFPVFDCDEPWTRPYIKPTGDFMPCPMFSDYSMGNIRLTSFEEIWNSQRARRIRKRLSKGLPSICQKCCVVHSGKQSRLKKLYRIFLGNAVFK